MNTEIYATFGPSCRDEAILKSMIEAGMTGMRLNLSHISLSDASEYIDNYKKASDSLGKKLQILIDMQGPELRVGDMPALTLENDVEYSLGEGGIAMPMEVIEALEENDEVLLDDGKLLCRVTADKKLKALRAGVLYPHKSIKIKGKDVKMPCLTTHDIENIKLAKDYGVSAIMQPFVRSRDDLVYVRKVLSEYNSEDIKIFAKIENLKGVKRLDEILDCADCIIIARGDLGNDMPLWELPGVQRRIEKACRENSVPYIVVTQMLASMENSPVPTRAEVSDIFHAVYNGAAGVMITGESAVGKYPVEAIKYLANTAKEAENAKRTC